MIIRGRLWLSVGGQWNWKHQLSNKRHEFQEDKRKQERCEARHEKSNWNSKSNGMSPFGWCYTFHCRHTSLSSVWPVSQMLGIHFSMTFLCTDPSILRPVSSSDNLYNTNRDFDWGTFKLLKEELTLSWTPPSFFSVVFNHPGVYVFTLSSHQHKHMVIQMLYIHIPAS